LFTQQPLVMDVWGLATMKNAANCDKQCDLQTSWKHKHFERQRYSWYFQEYTSFSAS